MKEETLTVDLNSLEKFCENVSQNLYLGNIICLFGELGSGKTTFTRNIIRSIYKKNKIATPNSIKSPSFPVLITYDVKKIEIYHYDLYRISSGNELSELNIFENIEKSITIIEWPEIILNELKENKFFSVKFEIIDNFTRKINHNIFI